MNNETLLACLQRLLRARGLYFSPWQLAAFYTALQAKGFVILGGPSGTGKTRLAQHLPALLPQPPDGNNWLFVSVRAEWRDSTALLGKFAAGAYQWTPLLRFLLRAVQSYEQGDGLAWFIILDEMNLAPVECYLADMLSVLESGWEEDGWTREAIRFDYPAGAPGDWPPRELRLPPNLYLIGTVNASNLPCPPQVLDRAFTLELEADLSSYLADATEEIEPDASEQQALLNKLTFDGTFTGHGYTDKHFICDYLARHPEVRRRLQTLNDALRPYQLAVGYRAFDEIVGFLDAAEYNAMFDDLGGAEAAFDAAVLMKIAPRLQAAYSQAPLCAALAWCANPDAPDRRAIDEAGTASQLSYRYPVTAARLRRMVEALGIPQKSDQSL